jgi:hypothetical protein
MTFPNGSVYTGTFKDDQQYGRGVLKTPEGEEYELEF